MDHETLRQRIARLHAELTDAHREDPAARQSLGEILPDIKRVVEKSDGAAATSTDATLADRLESVAVQFEAQHPTLAASARRLIDLLAEAGI
jgi:hypothetical protein